MARADKDKVPSKRATPAPGTQRGIAAQEEAKRAPQKPAVPKGPRRSPRWWAPLMVALMLIGLLIVVIAYVFSGAYPIPHGGNANILLGVAVMLVGFFMTLGWR